MSTFVHNCVQRYSDIGFRVIANVLNLEIKNTWGLLTLEVILKYAKDLHGRRVRILSVCSIFSHQLTIYVNLVANTGVPCELNLFGHTVHIMFA